MSTLTYLCWPLMPRASSRYKNSIMYYLLSHVNALNLGSARIEILRSLSLVSSSVKAISLLPSIEALEKHKGDIALTCLLVSSIDASSSVQLNGAEGELWNVYLQVLQHYLQPNSDAAPREIILRILETEIFAKLGYERQVAICETVIGIVARESDAVSASIALATYLC